MHRSDYYITENERLVCYIVTFLNLLYSSGMMQVLTRTLITHVLINVRENS